MILQMVGWDSQNFLKLFWNFFRSFSSGNSLGRSMEHSSPTSEVWRNNKNGFDSRTAFSFMAAINANPNLRKSLFYCNLWPLLSLYVIKRCLTDSREKFIICLFFNKNKKGGRDEPRICFCSKPPFSLLPDKFRQRTETKSGFSAMMAVAVARLSTFLTDRGLYFQQNMNVAIKARTEPISWKSGLYTESITWINWILDVILWQSDQECDVAEFTADVPQLSELHQ
jgi:hypothetical protein